METKNTNLHTMETLGHHLKAKFPEISAITAGTDFTWFIINTNGDINSAPFVKALNKYLEPYIAEHGNPKEEYEFTVKRANELIDILHFNNPEAAHLITLDLFGKTQNLRVQDVMGATGDYTLFNEDFETIGYLSAGVSPPTNSDGSLVNRDDMDNFNDEVYVDFSNQSIWQISPDELKPYLNEILGKVMENINSNANSLEVNVDDPVDLAFWAEQFELSESDLRKAVLAAGKSIDNITTYLQK
ncbi:DUF3606 domain-containing protein [Pedobacter sp. V48]|uniref:DUF3606 domain-containing protein n=1 Tax=Pedobacter sp. V48 TaxID=509635 RepID=UPI0003E45C28|nr:DUF3606 domain-containing protein [Pedobacter sp. V48]ETZ20175.1 hypothetical protein N824_08150 [Pedobacter sp. V48]